ncbi:MAG: metalloregulator ArsR/SmtB family transcription factor [Saccharofermentans sp.]|nr:metalloregulator ArsR/SmtB family transcription factor [Saccharofermentans sp.]
MNDDYLTEDLARSLSVIAEPVRIKILIKIASAGEICARDILPEFKITQPTLSHHLRLLTDSGILNARREGRFTYYSIDSETASDLSSFIMQLNEPPVVLTTPEARGVSKKRAQERRSQAKAPQLKKTSSVPVPKAPVEAPDIEQLKKKKKKKKKLKDKKKKK